MRFVVPVIDGRRSLMRRCLPGDCVEIRLDTGVLETSHDERQLFFRSLSRHVDDWRVEESSDMAVLEDLK